MAFPKPHERKGSCWASAKFFEPLVLLLFVHLGFHADVDVTVERFETLDEFLLIVAIRVVNIDVVEDVESEDEREI